MIDLKSFIWRRVWDSSSFALRGFARSHPVCNAILRVSSVRWLAELKLTEGERRLAERVGFVPVVPAPINDLGLIRSPQITKSTQNLSIRYKKQVQRQPTKSPIFERQAHTAVAAPGSRSLRIAKHVRRFDS